MREYRFGLVGCGRISSKHIDAIKSIPNAKLAAVCDINEDRAKTVSEKAGLDKYYLSYDEMLQKEEIDIINILTPSGLHHEHTIDIVKKYKKHIIVEKPMALKLSDADAMIRICDLNSVRLFVVKQNRYNLPVSRLRQAVENGDFGKIFMGSVRVRWSRDQKYYDQDEWRGTWKLDGGVLANQASHHIDLLEWMLGTPVSVMAKTETYMSDIEVDDTAAAIIKFENGAMGIIEATTATRPSDLEGSLSILGEKGSVVIGGFAVNKMEIWNFTGMTEVERDRLIAEYAENPPNVYGFGHIRYIEHVLDSIENNKQALVDGLEGRKSLELINAIYESAETAREVDLKFRPKRSRLGY
jgi:predicted dehydrogenase